MVDLSNIDWETACYNDILDNIADIVVQVDESNWQGDTWVLFKDNDKYGYLCFGWGSCSGCDALQGCKSEKEFQDLANHLEDSVLWFDSKEECRKYFTEKDFSTDYCWNADDFHTFLKQVREYLAK